MGRLVETNGMGLTKMRNLFEGRLDEVGGVRVRIIRVSSYMLPSDGQIKGMKCLVD